MANIDPARLLKTSPVENLSNLNTIDQAESLSDQSVTSFPKELQAAKQNNREDEASLDSNEQNSLETPANLQNLPTNAVASPKQPANIADQSKGSQEAMPNRLTPGGPTLAQLEIAQAITVEEGIVAQLSTPITTTVAQDPQILTEGQGDAEKQSSNTPNAAIDPTTALAIAAAQNSITLAPQNIVTPLAVETAAQGVQSLVATASQVDLLVTAAQTDLLATTSQATVAQSTAEVLAGEVQVNNFNSALNATQAVPATDNAGQEPLASISGLANTDVLTKSSANALNTINAAQVAAAANTNVLRTEPTDQDEAINVLAANAALNSQEEPLLMGAVTSEISGAVTSEISDIAAMNTAKSAKAAQAAQSAAASLQSIASAEQGINLASANQSNVAVQNTAPSLTASPQAELAANLVKVDVSDTQELANAVQSPTTSSLRVDSRGISANDPGEVVQSLRIDNAKIASVNAEKSAVLDGLALQDKPITDSQDSTQVASSNSGGGLSDLNSRTITSPFSQELRLAQSSQTLKLEPQQASLSSGPLHVEVMRVLREGGGRVIMEVTPPDQGAIQLDLRLDGNGRAYLIVEGASDSTKARLEQGGSQLKEQLAQMGLSLSLDMRDRSTESDHVPFALNQQFSNAANGSGTQVDAGLGELVSVSRPGVTPDGRVSIYA
jgi:hypothetical protein